MVFKNNRLFGCALTCSTHLMAPTLSQCIFCLPGGGFHHCSSDRGGGFCAYADITLAIKVRLMFFTPTAHWEHLFKHWLLSPVERSPFIFINDIWLKWHHVTLERRITLSSSYKWKVTFKSKNKPKNVYCCRPGLVWSNRLWRLMTFCSAPFLRSVGIKKQQNNNTSFLNVTAAL